MNKINAVILAGDRKASLLVDNDNKAFLKVNNIPCIIYTLRSFIASESIDSIIIVGPSDRLEKILGEYNIKTEGRIKIIEQRESLIENGEAGYFAVLEKILTLTDTESNSHNVQAGGRPDLKQDLSSDTPLFSHETIPFYREKYPEVPILISSCDIPLITPGEIDEFVEKSDIDKYDYIIGLTNEDVLKDYYPTETDPGMRLNYFHLREGNYRVNNLCIVKPFKIERLEYIERMYEVRYQTHFFNMLKLLIRILFNGRGILRALFKALKLHIALYCFDRGYMKLYPRVKEAVRIDRVFKSIGMILGTKAAYVVTTYGGAALDIDHPEDREVIEKMYARWMEHQKSLNTLNN